MASILSSHLAIEPVGPDEFVSQEYPSSFGNPANVAYGGCAVGIATRAAYATAPAGYNLYSLVGGFRGPARTTEKLLCTVERTRDTRTFATRRVLVRQRVQPPDGQDGGAQEPVLRVCLELTADFHAAEPEPALLTYAAPPAMAFSGPAASPTLAEMTARAVAGGLLPADPTMAGRGDFERCFEMRHCPEGVTGQNVLGMAAWAATDQDGRHVTERVSGEWVRVAQDDTTASLASDAEKGAAHAFYMDGVPFVVVAHNHLHFPDVAASLTIDFALRVFVPVVDLNRWHLRERRTLAAGLGRAYSEARLFDEAGNMVASMTQQSILRGRDKTKGEGKKKKASL